MDGPASERITTPEIIEAITSTLTNARVEGDPYKNKAEEHLGPIEAILQSIARDRRELEFELNRTQVQLEEIDEKTEAFLHSCADDIWEHLARPDYDPIYNILFPSIAAKRESSGGQAEQLSLVADLLESGLHPKIAPDVAADVAREVRKLAAEYYEPLFVLSKHQYRKSALDAFEAAVARIGLLELGALRKTLRSMGVDDSNIRCVVPPPLSSRRVPMK